MDEIVNILIFNEDKTRKQLYLLNMWNRNDKAICTCPYHSIQWGISFKLRERPSNILPDWKRYLIGRD